MRLSYPPAHLQNYANIRPPPFAVVPRQLPKESSMTKVDRVAAGLVLGLLMSTADGQEAQCAGGMSNDKCDQWQFEQANKDLELFVASKVSEFDSRTTRKDLIEQIKAFITDAQRSWLIFRDLECKAVAAAQVQSARTRKGLTYSCLLELTQKRIKEIKSF